MVPCCAQGQGSEPQAKIAAADALASRSRHAEAMALYEEVLRSDPRSADARRGEVQSAVQMSLADKRRGDQQSALGYLLRARSVVPDDPGLLYDIGVQAEQMRLYADAEKALLEAERLRPGDAKTTYALARVKIDRDDLQEGERLLRVYLAAMPDDASAHYGLGLTLHRGLQEEEAAKEFRRSIALQPQQTESQYQMGMIALSAGDLAEAHREFAAVVERAPQHGGALTGLGQVAIRQKNYTEARVRLDAAVAAAPDYAEAHRYLAIALTKLGEGAAAKLQVDEADRLTAQQNQQRKGYTLQQP